MIKFKVHRRINTHKKKGKEYALMATDSRTDATYVLFVWDKKPTNDEVEITTSFLMGAMHFSQHITPKNTPNLDYSVDKNY